MNIPPATSPTTSPTSPFPLQNVSENGAAPKHRIANASDAQQLVIQLIEAGRERDRFSAKIQGMLDGNPPFDHTRLRAAGQLNRSNVNFLEGKAALDAALTPYYDIFSSAQYYADVKTKLGQTAEEREEWSRIITAAFHRLLASYDQFDFNVQTMIHDRTAFGKGYFMWPDKQGWHFETVRHYRVRVPNGAKASLCKGEIITVSDPMECHTLWGKIADKKAAKEAGWNIQAVVDALLGAMPDDLAAMASGPESYHFIQQFYKDKDLYQGNRLPTVQVVHLFVKEFSGKVSHLIVLQNQSPYASKHDIAPQYLFSDYECYDSFNQCMSACFFATLDGSWNGASGLGRDILSAMEIKNRLKNAAVDNAFIRAGITLQAQTAEAMTKTSLVQIGALNIIPPDYAVQQATILGDVEGLLSMDMALDNMLASNTGVYRAKLEKQPGNPVTAEEYRGRQTSSATLNNSAVNRFYQELDFFYTEVYRRVTQYSYTGKDAEAKAVKDFYEECVNQGVPKEAIKQVLQVRAFRNIGNGSMFMRQQSITQTMPFVPMLSELGKQNWMDDAIAAMAGQEAVDRWNPKLEDRMPTDQEWTAMIENGTLGEGAPVTVTSTQNNVIHAQVHLQAMAQGAASLKDGGNPGDVLKFLEMAGPHVAQHLQLIAADPARKGVYDALSEQWTQLAKITDDLKKSVGDAIQQEMQAQGPAGVKLDKIGISYKDLPESEKRQVEIALGLQPDGEVSASQENLNIRKNQAVLRAQKQGQDMALKDVDMAMKIKQEAQNVGV